MSNLSCCNYWLLLIISIILLITFLSNQEAYIYLIYLSNFYNSSRAACPLLAANSLLETLTSREWHVLPTSHLAPEFFAYCARVSFISPPLMHFTYTNIYKIPISGKLNWCRHSACARTHQTVTHPPNGTASFRQQISMGNRSGCNSSRASPLSSPDPRCGSVCSVLLTA